MQTILHDLAKRIRPAICRVDPPAGRDLTKLVHEALKATRTVIEKRFGGPIVCRYSGCSEDGNSRFTKDRHTYKVIEYLWDFSFSRFAITQAIEDAHATPITEGEFQLVFVAECEMWRPTEVCRDLLKLLEARTEIRCLVYKQYVRDKTREEFKKRMIRVLHNHAHFKRSPGLWLFVELTRRQRKLDCDFYTLNKELSGFVPIDTNAT